MGTSQLKQSSLSIITQLTQEDLSQAHNAYVKTKTHSHCASISFDQGQLRRKGCIDKLVLFLAIDKALYKQYKT